MNKIGRDFNSEIVINNINHNKIYYTVNVISYDEEIINEETGEVTTTNFSYITSLKITNQNKEKNCSI